MSWMFIFSANTPRWQKDSDIDRALGLTKMSQDRGVRIYHKYIMWAKERNNPWGIKIYEALMALK